MLCDICKKREATVHLTEVVNEEVTELHICEKCAKQKSAQMQQHFGIADLLSGLADFPHELVPKQKRISIKCPSCGMSYNDFRKLGRFGCADCYEAFKRALYPLFKKIHGVSYRAENEPQKPALSKKPQTPENMPAVGSAKAETESLEELRAMLAEAVKREEFEKAAVLRDKIKAIASQKRKGEKGRGGGNE